MAGIAGSAPSYQRGCVCRGHRAYVQRGGGYAMEGDAETLEVTSAGARVDGGARCVEAGGHVLCVMQGRAEGTRVRRESEGKARKEYAVGWGVSRRTGRARVVGATRRYRGLCGGARTGDPCATFVSPPPRRARPARELISQRSWGGRTVVGAVHNVLRRKKSHKKPQPQAVRAAALIVLEEVVAAALTGVGWNLLRGKTGVGDAWRRRQMRAGAAARRARKTRRRELGGPRWSTGVASAAISVDVVRRQRQTDVSREAANDGRTGWPAISGARAVKEAKREGQGSGMDVRGSELDGGNAVA
ncbi:hypothetical protein DFH08DRAFT_936701 [Mycena albidolilacea]|uniref:Uncharacterized protein n=1 Tax=Mycena albidolilacea TaxID=1033008 RepID=A0AAD7A299_9AGAR|nr:hypothetical protein DFH08DRAFT_936701 [Mycena albidolilacea]